MSQDNPLTSITTYNYVVASIDSSSGYLQDLAFIVTLPLFLWGFSLWQYLWSKYAALLHRQIKSVLLIIF